MSQNISSSYLMQLQDTLPALQEEVSILKDTLVAEKKLFKKVQRPKVDTVNHKDLDTLSYFFYNLEVVQPAQDSILFKTLEDAPDFYVDSVIKADRENLTTHYDEYNNYMKILPSESSSLNLNTNDWVSGVLFFIFALLLLVKTMKAKFITDLRLAAFQYREFSKTVGNHNYSELNVTNLLTLIYTMGISLFIYLGLLFIELDYLPHSFFFFSLLVAFFLLSILLKRAIIFLSGFFLSQKELTLKYNKNIQLFNNSLGLLIIPFILSIPFIEYMYVEVLVYSTISLIAFLYLARIIRALKIFIEYNVSILYMILYLCTLEILPNLLMYKTLELVYWYFE